MGSPRFIPNQPDIFQSTPGKYADLTSKIGRSLHLSDEKVQALLQINKKFFAIIISLKEDY